jgi:asparagine synthetase B (glutamine-hydrolysing)
MAGIAGIFLKQKNKKAETYLPAFEAMMDKLSASDGQLQKYHIDSSFLFGNAVAISTKNNDRFQFLESLNIYCVFDGLLFINDQEKFIIRKQYQINDEKSDYELLPYLYDFYSTDIVNHITGWYNIFLVDATKQESLLLNDRLGYSPLYYYESDLFFVFASKIECILSSGLMSSLNFGIEFDVTTIAEQMFFNHSLSDNTFIKGIHTLPNALSISFNSHGTKWEKYWGIEEFFDLKKAGQKESFNLINNGLKTAISKVIPESGKEINLSLTGGWDSRVVLSLLMPEYKDKLRLYSFGAENSDDIIIPEYIAGKEHVRYDSYILDQDYLDQDFIPDAQKTIELSNGTRNYKRTHYLYAIQKIASFSDMLVSGIFGDEVFKVAQTTGGNVLSQNTIDIIGANFNLDQTLKKFSSSGFLNTFHTDHKKLTDEFSSRLEKFQNKTDKFDTDIQKYYYVRFELNLRKYFGAEVNSYNDYVYCFSPFIDHDFLTNFAQTSFMDTHYNKDSNELKRKMEITSLYANLIKQNYKPLIYYNTARGYSMFDAITLAGKFKILAKKYLNKKTNKIDGFNTNPTDQLFNNFLLESLPQKSKQQLLLSSDYSYDKTAQINSMIYWMHLIKSRYC